MEQPLVHGNGKVVVNRCGPVRISDSGDQSYSPSEIRTGPQERTVFPGPDLAAAELDPPNFVQQFELLKDAACKRPSGCITAG